MSGLEMKYFVLNPTKNNRYGRASRNAIRVYADDVWTENPKLCYDLKIWIDSIEQNLEINPAPGGPGTE